MADKIKITQTKSSIRTTEGQKRTLAALGLRGIGKSVVHGRGKNIDGMILRVEHLVKTEDA